jgi:hypothetical protein
MNDECHAQHTHSVAAQHMLLAGLGMAKNQAPKGDE